MTIEKFFKQLKTLRAIEPDKAYSENSLHLILASTETVTPLSWNMLFARVGTLAAVFGLVVVVAGNSAVPMKLAGLDTNQLKAEAEELAVSLELAELRVVAESPSPISVALEETAKSDPGHLNTLVLERESDQLVAEEYYDTDIDAALKALVE